MEYRCNLTLYIEADSPERARSELLVITDDLKEQRVIIDFVIKDVNPT